MQHCMGRWLQQYLIVDLHYFSMSWSCCKMLIILQLSWKGSMSAVTLSLAAMVAPCSRACILKSSSSRIIRRWRGKGRGATSMENSNLCHHYALLLQETCPALSKWAPCSLSQSRYRSGLYFSFTSSLHAITCSVKLMLLLIIIE